MNANARSFSWSLCYKTRKDQISDPWLAITYVTNKVFFDKGRSLPKQDDSVGETFYFLSSKKKHTGTTIKLLLILS